MDQKKDRSVIKNLQKKGMKPKEIHEVIAEKFAEDSLFYATVKWDAKFKQGRDRTEDEIRSGPSKISKTNELVGAIHGMIMDD